MKYLLDTHIILWALSDSSKLDPSIRNIILNTDNQIYYSTVSPWETEIKHQKISSFKLSGKQLAFLCDINGIINLPINNKHVEQLASLTKSEDIIHKDPFDKMLISQARCENMILITHDQKLSAYGTNNIMVV